MSGRSILQAVHILSVSEEHWHLTRARKSPGRVLDFDTHTLCGKPLGVRYEAHWRGAATCPDCEAALKAQRQKAVAS